MLTNRRSRSQTSLQGGNEFYPYFPHLLSDLGEIWSNGHAYLLLRICESRNHWRMVGRTCEVKLYHT
jgi:hypothetical protein